MDAHPPQTRELAPKLAAGYQSPTGASGGACEGNIDSSRQPLNQQSFRRRRKGRACSACHLRRIRCDAASLGVPCTNCTAFSVHCFIPPRRKKKRPAATTGEGGSSSLQGKDGQNPEAANPNPKTKSRKLSNAKRKYDGRRTDTDDVQPEATRAYAHLVQPEIATAPIKQSGRVAYLAEHSNMSLLLEAQSGVAGSDNTHLELPDSFKDVQVNNGSGQLDEFEITILNMQGALALPPESLCDELVEAYFTWVAPLVPVINRSRFMQQYKASRHPPSLLLLNAICLAGSRVCNTVQLLDENGSPISAATIFYRRAKALYESGYETDRITIVQALVLMGWYWEESGKVTRNVFYWLGLAVTVAEGFGLHRNTNKSRLSIADKRLWKRIWWTLFTRDRSVAVAMGRPVHINMSHSDVEMLCEDDFIEDDDGLVALSPPDSLHVEFFLQYIKICQIMDLILVQHYSISSRAERHHALALTECDLALAAWLKNCPGIVKWDPGAYQFWPALLHCFYHTASCLMHRAHLPPRAPTQDEQRRDRAIFPRRNPAFQSACEVTAVIECMIIHNEICCSPPFMVYALMTALLVLIYEMHTAVGDNYIALQKRTWVCMHALRKLSNVWLVAKMAHKLFESIIATAGFEDCLQESNNDNEFKRGCNVKLDDSGNECDESIPKQSPKSQRSPKPSEPALTAALIDSMNAALKSLTLSVDPKTMHGVGFNTTTMGPSPLASHDTSDREANHTESGTSESSPYSNFMATLRPHELFSKDIPFDIRKLQGQSSSSAMQQLTLPEQMSPWNLSVEIPTLQAEQYSGQFHPRRASATTTVFGWHIEQ